MIIGNYLLKQIITVELKEIITIGYSVFQSAHSHIAQVN